MHSIRFALKILLNPEKEFNKIHKKEVDYVLIPYFKLSLLSSFLAALFYFLYSIIKIGIQATKNSIQVNYNIATLFILSNSFALFFIYFFLYTLGVLILSFILKAIIRKKYLLIVKALLTALTPSLLILWIPVIGSGSLIYSAILFINLMLIKNKKEVSKDI